MALSLAACTNSDTDITPVQQSQNVSIKNTNENEENNSMNKQLDEIKQILTEKQDEQLSKELAEEMLIESSTNSIMDDLEFVTLTLNVAESVNETIALELAKKNAQLTKEKYPEYEIYVVVQKNNITFVEYTLE